MERLGPRDWRPSSKPCRVFTRPPPPPLGFLLLPQPPFRTQEPVVITAHQDLPRAGEREGLMPASCLGLRVRVIGCVVWEGSHCFPRGDRRSSVVIARRRPRGTMGPPHHRNWSTTFLGYGKSAIHLFCTYLHGGCYRWT
jgi:hypothetical protein